MKFKECEHCGAALDFGEKCTCKKEKQKKLNKILSLLSTEEDGQVKIEHQEKIDKISGGN